MPYYSERSKRRLHTCHSDLQTLMYQVIKNIDVTILEGLRGKEKQNRLHEQGLTQLRWPNSKHNREVLPKVPRHYERISEDERSLAVDVAPYPIDWNDFKRFRDVGFYILGTADALYSEGKLGHQVRWGADWNQNYSIEDESFIDAVHFELIV